MFLPGPSPDTKSEREYISHMTQQLLNRTDALVRTIPSDQPETKANLEEAARFLEEALVRLCRDD